MSRKRKMVTVISVPIRDGSNTMYLSVGYGKARPRKNVRADFYFTEAGDVQAIFSPAGGKVLKKKRVNVTVTGAELCQAIWNAVKNDPVLR